MSSLESGGLVENLQKNSPAPASPSVPVPAQAPATYQDNDEPPSGETLESIDESDLTMLLTARIEFGMKLSSMVGVKNLIIKAAKTLAPSKAINNAFKSSYFYDHASNTLHVHHKKISQSGDFGLVMIHALSHIKVNPKDLSNDADIMYMAEFYKNLKLLSKDLYKKSSSSNAGASTPQILGSVSRENSRDVGGKQKSLSKPIRTSSSSDLNKDYFAPDSMRERLKMYTSESNNGTGMAAASIPGNYFDRYSQEKKLVDSPHKTKVPAALEEVDENDV